MYTSNQWITKTKTTTKTTKTIIIIIIIIIIMRRRRRKGLDAVRSSPCSRNYKTGGICRQEGRPTNTGCQNTPT
jgi:hypothetical protein